MFRAKSLFILLACVFILAAVSCRHKAGHNIYREAKVRPSERQLKADKKHNKAMDKAYKKQMRHNRKKLYGSPTDPGAPKK